MNPGYVLQSPYAFLATGDSYMSLQYSFRVAHNTISAIVPETCRAIVTVFGEEELRLPQTEEQWQDVARGFWNRWNFPNVIGAIDGKHIRLRNPARGGSYYYNYKKYYSMILLGVVDSEYRFLYIDVGTIGSESDGGVFAQTRLRELVESNEAHIPPATQLPGDRNGQPCDYFFVGDDAFALRHYMMKPYPQRFLQKEERVFNYRLSRARRTVENAFGILANRFRVFHTSMCLRPDNGEAVVMGACVLHNMLRTRKLSSVDVLDREDPCTHNLIEGTWRQDPAMGTPMPSVHGRTNSTVAKNQRNLLKDYLSSPIGSVPWQDNMI